MTEALIFGYPPIPFTSKPHLVAARAEINGVIDLEDIPHVHFVLSAMPRGGFSGGLALLENGIALGVVTSGLRTATQATEMGFFTVLSVEPIYTCLDESKLLPKTQWDGEF